MEYRTMPVQKSSRYVQVYLDLKSRITGGDYPLGSRIPVEKELLRSYDISITTLRRAVEMLCEDGLLKKKQGAGTFVTDPDARAAARESGSSVSAAANPATHSVRKCAVAVVMPDVTRITPVGDVCNWQLNMRKLNGIYRAAVELGIYVSVFDMSEKFDFSGYDGALIFRSFELEEPDVFDALVEPLKAADKPYVVLSEYDPRFCDRFWVAENIECEFLEAYRYLQRLGVGRLLLLGRNLTEENPRIHAMSYLPRRFECEFLENPTSDRDGAFAAMRRFLNNGGDAKKYDAVFCMTDLQALGAMDALLDAGYSIPGDIGVMGCDNIADGEQHRVPLTTFQFTGPMVGRVALKLLSDALADRSLDGFIVNKRCSIVERESMKINLSTH